MSFKEGVFEGLSYEEYAEIEAWRSHDLTTIIADPYTWKNQKAIVQTPALLEGRVQHTVFLELDKFNDEFVIEPKFDRRTKAGKDEYEDFMSSVGDRTPIKQELFDVCMDRREVVLDHVPSDDDKVELTLCFMWNGKKCKARLDWYDGSNIWDLKTCRDASPRGFTAAIRNFRYYQQAAFYLMGCKILGMEAEQFFFLAQQKAHPYPYLIYTLSDEAVTYGDAKNEQAMQIAEECGRKGKWLPFNHGGIVTVDATQL